MKGYVYRIFCKDPNVLDCYIGSTKDIKTRMRGHKCDVEYETGDKYHSKKYEFIRSHGGWGNWDHIVLESLEVESTEVLRMWEQNWIDETPTATLNDMPAWRSEEDKKELHARWRDENREKYTEYQAKYQAKYHEANREKILERKAKHYRENKEKMLEYQAMYREANKEKMLVKIECNFCGAFVTRSNMKRHQKRPICLNNRIPLQD